MCDEGLVFGTLYMEKPSTNIITNSCYACTPNTRSCFQLWHTCGPRLDCLLGDHRLTDCPARLGTCCRPACSSHCSWTVPERVQQESGLCFGFPASHVAPGVLHWLLGQLAGEVSICCKKIYIHPGPQLSCLFISVSLPLSL